MVRHSVKISGRFENLPSDDLYFTLLRYYNIFISIYRVDCLRFPQIYISRENHKQTHQERIMNASQLISSLTQTVGEKYIITDPAKTEQYRQGYRFGEGRALAVVRPEPFWKCGKFCRPASKRT